MMAISILLADDHEIFRQGLRLLLENQPDIKVVGHAADGLEAVAQAERLRPDVVVVDMLMPGLTGMDVTRQIKQRLPQCQVVILSMYDDESYVLNALREGASCYVLKESSADDLVQAVRAAIAGQRYLSPSLTERVIQTYITQTHAKETDAYATLTNREREVLHLVAQGCTGPETARRLSISPRTVETHRANLMHKLGLHSQMELVEYARKQKII
jgi:two-component system response regulator NreC